MVWGGVERGYFPMDMTPDIIQSNETPLVLYDTNEAGILNVLPMYLNLYLYLHNLVPEYSFIYLFIYPARGMWQEGMTDSHI